MKKFEFELSDEAAENILSIIHHEIIKFKYENQMNENYSDEEKQWFMSAADALEEDYNVMLKGMK